jgi:hypothetical protein
MSTLSTIRRAGATGAVALAALLAGCASLNSVRSTVATYGTWPADTRPGTYAFERLPSQDANPKRQLSLENAAAQALATAGFQPAAEGAKSDVTVQIGARIERFEASPWDDPLWFPGRRHFGGWGPGPGPWFAPYGPYYGGGPYGPYWRPWGPGSDQYLREVALLIRDSASGKPLYEARANNDGITEGGDRLLSAMFIAALSDFPRAEAKAHDVVVPMTAVPSAAPLPAPAASAG